MKDSQTGKDSLWQRLWSPSARWSVGALLVAGIVIGVVGWMGFDAAITWTNTEQFCLSCHEMRDNVYQEYRGTIHDINRTGVRAVCADCHVPKPLV
ncbi:MAG: NapC/NirT family cytochrome c, partial [Rhodocyclaceae bacterium]|nr:NapC/NirT family cytochrome c [Rhodocyclaceae bacterium]